MLVNKIFDAMPPCLWERWICAYSSRSAPFQMGALRQISIGIQIAVPCL